MKKAKTKITHNPTKLNRIINKLASITNFVKNHKLLVFGLLILLLILPIISLKSYLFFHFVLGNDSTIEVKPDRTHLSLRNGEVGSVQIGFEVITNPFCTAKCFTELKNLYTQEIENSQEYVLVSGIQEEEVLSINSSGDVEGYTYYTFGISCKINKSFLCRTSGNSPKKDILITLEHDLNKSQQNENKAIETDLELAIRRKLELEYKSALQEQDIKSLNKTLDVKVLRTMLKVLDTTIKNVNQTLIKAKNSWTLQKRSEVAENLQTSEIFFNQANSALNELSQKINLTRALYNTAISNTNFQIRAYNDVSSNTHLLDYNFTREMTLRAKSINELLTNATIVRETEKKFGILNDAREKLSILISDIQSKKQKELKKTLFENSLITDVYCTLNQSCNLPPEIPKDLLEACEQKRIIKNLLKGGNVSNDSSVIQALEKINLKVLEKHLEQARINNDTFIEDAILEKYHMINLSENTSTNLSEILTHFKGISNVSECQLSVMDVELTPLENITIEEHDRASINPIELPLQKKLGCFENECFPCCDEQCMKKTPPLMIIHGHALSEDTAPDFSLNSLSGVSDFLKETGRADLGIFTSYPRTSDFGGWKCLNKTILLRASYYLDEFLMPDDLGFSLVHRKTENIDTYAIKLNEIINELLQRTGRDQLDIIAHSMGGLVTRRYMQIFSDEKIRKVILLGTPNHGVEGRVADFCDLTGSDLECRDLTKGSLLLNKLNRDNRSNNKITNIMGRGCNMKEGDGDGIVLASNAQLEGAVNIFVEGNCTGKILHQKLLDVKDHPEIAKAITEALN